jgi:hypothetical protein
MDTISNNISAQNMVHTTYPRMYEIVNSQLLELNIRELMLVYEMIRLIKQPKEPIKMETEIINFPFLQVQEALKGITGNLSDDIINIEREDRV